MLHVISSQTSEFLVMLNQAVDLFAEQVDAFFITDHLYFTATRYEFQLRKIFSDHFKIAVVDTEKFNGVEGVNGNNYFAQ